MFTVVIDFSSVPSFTYYLFNYQVLDNTVRIYSILNLFFFLTVVYYPLKSDIRGLKRQELKKELHCTQSPILKNVTLRGGAKSGKLSDLGEVESMHVCTALCCERRSCDLAMMIGRTCIGVDCYSEELCLPIAARPSHNNPQLSYIRRRALRTAGESRKGNLL